MGVVVNNYPPIIKPKERTQDFPIPARAGSLTEVEGEDVYEPYVRPCQCYTLPEANLAAIAAWLKGSGVAVFGNEPTMAYTARIDGQISMDKILANHAHRSFTIPFVCQPFKHMANPVDYILTSGKSMLNIGTVSTLPLFIIEGSGDINLSVGDQLVQFADISGGIIMDCEMPGCYELDATNSLNHKMSGEFPRIRTGATTISWTGTVTKVTIRPRWRWI